MNRFGLIRRLSLFFVVGICLAPAVSIGGDAAFDAWAEKLAAESVRMDPEGATRAQYFSGEEQDKLDRMLTPITKAHREEETAFARRALTELAKFDREKLDAQQKVSARLIEWHMQQKLKGDAFEDHRLIFNQFRGLHVSLLQFLTQVHPIRNRRDAENYLARLAQVAGKLDEGIAQTKDAAGRGFLMPDFITKSAIGTLDRLLEGPAPTNILVKSFDERLTKLKEVSAEDRKSMTGAAEKLTRDEIIPALERVRGLLKEQLPKTTADAGLWRLPQGKEAYSYALELFTTTPLEAREVHQIGLSEVERIEKEMDGLLKKLGYTEGRVKERFEKLNRDSQPKPAKEGELDPRVALLKRYEEILADSLSKAQALFDLQPKAPCVVVRELPFTEKTAAAHYTTPARDGSRPGQFWVPLPGPEFKIINMRTLTYHEAIPGHHFQLALVQELANLPRWRQDAVFGRNSANAEGWALYAEQLAVEAGWYGDDVKGHLGQLEAELFRAKRLVSDTGLHAMQWTREQAIEYGIPVAETERYVVMPGQACSYKIGQLKILELRARAKKELGEKFSLREFHNTVLRAGIVPLPVLETIVGDWIAGVRKG